MKILAVIVARAQSKGVPKKNIKILYDKPLLAWSIIEAKKSKYIDRLILSTEDDEIAEIGRFYGIDVPFKRPLYLAKDDTHTPDILIHAVKQIENIDDTKYDAIVLLQPTVPFRTSDQIDEAILKFKSSKFDSLITLKKQNYPPWWMFRVKNEILYQIFKLDDSGVNVFNLERQQFPEVFKPNGSVYITLIKLLKKNKQLVNPYNCGTLIINDELQINIDTQFDFIVAEQIAKLKYDKKN